MNATYTTLLLGFALCLAALIPLTLALRARYKAIGYARGYRSGRAEQYTRVQHLHDEIGRQKHMRDIERQGHQQRIEAVMQDCDDRIAIYARRSNPFTADDYATLQAIADKLELAASTFAGLGSPDHARFARQLHGHAQAMAERLRTALQRQQPSEASTANAPQESTA